MTQLGVLLKRGSALSLLTNFIELTDKISLSDETDIKKIVDLMLNNGDIVFTDWDIISQKIQAKKEYSATVAKRTVKTIFNEQAIVALSKAVIINDKPLVDAVATESLSAITKELNVDKTVINIAALLKCKSDSEKELEKHYLLLESALDVEMRSMINKYSKHFPESYQTTLHRIM